MAAFSPLASNPSRCNCTICTKTGFTGISVEEPSKNFHLLSPKSFEDLPDYTITSPNIHRHFCTKCGVTFLGRGYYEFNGQKMDFFSVNLATVDQPQEGIDLSAFKIEYWDGRHE